MATPRPCPHCEGKGFIMDTLVEARAAGYSTGVAGAPYENPYDTTSKRFLAWRRGWKKGRTHFLAVSLTSGGTPMFGSLSGLEAAWAIRNL